MKLKHTLSYNIQYSQSQLQLQEVHKHQGEIICLCSKSYHQRLRAHPTPNQIVARTQAVTKDIP